MSVYFLLVCVTLAFEHLVEVESFASRTPLPRGDPFKQRRRLPNLTSGARRGLDTKLGSPQRAGLVIGRTSCACSCGVRDLYYNPNGHIIRAVRKCYDGDPLTLDIPVSVPGSLSIRRLLHSKLFAVFFFPGDRPA